MAGGSAGGADRHRRDSQGCSGTARCGAGTVRSTPKYRGSSLPEHRSSQPNWLSEMSRHPWLVWRKQSLKSAHREDDAVASFAGNLPDELVVRLVLAHRGGGRHVAFMRATADPHESHEMPSLSWGKRSSVWHGGSAAGARTEPRRGLHRLGAHRPAGTPQRSGRCS